MFRFVHGSWISDGCFVKPVSRSQSPVLIGGFAAAHTVTMAFEGLFQADYPSDNATLAFILTEQLKIPNLPCGIQYYNGFGWENTVYWFSFDGSLLEGPTVKNLILPGGPLVHIVDAPFSFSIEATYSNTQSGRDYFEYSEMIEYSGEGKSIWALAPQATLKSIYQKTAEYSDVGLTQSGRLVRRGALLAEMPVPIITDPRAKITLSTKEGRKFTQRQTGVLVNELSYSYSFQLPEKPTGLIPGKL